MTDDEKKEHAAHMEEFHKMQYWLTATQRLLLVPYEMEKQRREDARHAPIYELVRRPVSRPPLSDYTDEDARRSRQRREQIEKLEAEVRGPDEAAHQAWRELVIALGRETRARCITVQVNSWIAVAFIAFVVFKLW